MAEDIAPALLEKVEKNFRGKVKDRKLTKSVMKQRARDGTLRTINNYTDKLGKALSEAFLEEILPEILPDETLYYNIAERVLIPPIEEAHDMVSDVADELQVVKNKKAGLGLKSKRPSIQMDRVDGLIDLLTEGPFADNVHYLNEPIRNLVDHFGDYHTEKNAEFLSNSNVGITITRIAEATACSWCKEKEGVYHNYREASDHDVFARHEGCRCELILAGNGRSGKMGTSGHGFVGS